MWAGGLGMKIRLYIMFVPRHMLGGGGSFVVTGGLMEVGGRQESPRLER